MKTDQQYVDTPSHCPNCDSVQVHWGELEMDESSGWRDAVCYKCKAEWNEIIQLTGYTITKYPNEVENE